jgi:hypothetical protein
LQVGGQYRPLFIAGDLLDRKVNRSHDHNYVCVFHLRNGGSPKTGKRIRILPSRQTSMLRSNDSAGEQIQNSRRPRRRPIGVYNQFQKSRFSRHFNSRPSQTIETAARVHTLGPLHSQCQRSSHAHNFRSPNNVRKRISLCPS